MKKSLIISMAVLAVSCFIFAGCDALEVLSNNVSICTLVNCDELGIVDIAGPHNSLVPDSPDYSKDPTCTLPGFCGANPWYPYSTAETVEPTPVGGE
jgi:hypothetical protein